MRALSKTYWAPGDDKGADQSTVWQKANFCLAWPGLLGLQKPWYIYLWNTVARVPNNQSVPRSLFIALSCPLVLVQLLQWLQPSELPNFLLFASTCYSSIFFLQDGNNFSCKKLFETKLTLENKIVGNASFPQLFWIPRKSCTVDAS